MLTYDRGTGNLRNWKSTILGSTLNHCTHKKEARIGLTNAHRCVAIGAVT